MVPRANLGGNSIYPSAQSTPSRGVLPTSKSFITDACAHSGDFAGDREV